MKRTTYASVVSFALGGALVLSGCGSSTDTSAPPAVASSATSAAPTAAATTSASAPSTGAPATAGSTVNAGDLAATMSKAMIAAKSGKATMSMAGSGVNMSGSSQFIYTTPTQADTTATMSIMGLNLELVSAGGVMYMKGLPTQMSGGKPWVKIDPNGSDEMSKALREAGGGNGNPQAVVDALKGGTATVVDTNGANTHYRITGFAAVGASGTSGTSGASGATMDLTVDSKNLPVTSVVEASGAKVSVEYSDWGTPVTVTAPPADQVGTLTIPTKS